MDVVAGLEERIDLLKKVNSYENGYKLVLPMCAEKGNHYVSNHNKFTIRQKSLFLLKAYQIALDEMRVGVRWLDHVCHKAVGGASINGCQNTTMFWMTPMSSLIRNNAGAYVEPCGGGGDQRW